MNDFTYIKTMMLLSVVIITTFFLVVSCGQDQLNMESDYVALSGDPKSAMDIRFLMNATECNIQQIQLGQLAQKKGATAEVKAVGKMMEREHKRNLSELKTLAKEKLIILPSSPSNKAHNGHSLLNTKAGKDFDNEYCRIMVEEHRREIALFEEASAKAYDPEIKAWASNSVQALKLHLDHSIACQRKCKKL